MNFSERDVCDLSVKYPHGVDLQVGENNYRFVGNSGGPIRLTGDKVAKHELIDIGSGWFSLEPGASVLMESSDYYMIPAGMKAYLSISKEAIDAGLSVEPEFPVILNGYSGRLRYTVRNIAGVRAVIFIGEPIVHVTFESKSQ